MSLSVDRALCFPSGPRLVRIPEGGREYMLSSLWFGLGLYAFGMENGVHLPIVCVTVTVRVHAVVCYHSFVYERVSELSQLPQLSVGEQHSKVNNSTSPLFLVAIFKACFCWYPFSFPPFSFSHHLLRFWLSLAFSHPQHLSHTHLELANSSNGSCNRRSASAAARTRRGNKEIYFNMTVRSSNLVSSCQGPFPRCRLGSRRWRCNGWLH